MNLASNKRATCMDTHLHYPVKFAKSLSSSVHCAAITIYAFFLIKLHLREGLREYNLYRVCESSQEPLDGVSKVWTY